MLIGKENLHKKTRIYFNPFPHNVFDGQTRGETFRYKQVDI